MSNKLKMDKVTAIKNIASQGRPQRRIARELGIHRNAARRAIEATESGDDSKRAIPITGNPPRRDSNCEPFKAHRSKQRSNSGLTPSASTRTFEPTTMRSRAPTAPSKHFVKPLKQSEPNLEPLELVLQDEHHMREQRSIERRVKVASFRETRSLDSFNLHSAVGATYEGKLFV